MDYPNQPFWHENRSCLQKRLWVFHELMQHLAHQRCSKKFQKYKVIYYIKLFILVVLQTFCPMYSFNSEFQEKIATLGHL